MRTTAHNAQVQPVNRTAAVDVTSDTIRWLLNWAVVMVVVVWDTLPVTLRTLKADRQQLADRQART